MRLTCGLFPLSAGTEQEGKLPKKRLEVRLEGWRSRTLAKHYHRDIEVRRLGLRRWPCQEFSYLPDAGFCLLGKTVGLLLNPPLLKQNQVLSDHQGRRIVSILS